MLGELLAEFFGTFIILVFGGGIVAMVQLFGTGVPGEVVHGGYTNITIGWGLAVTMGVFVSGRISGAHLNPAVTIPLAIYRGFPWSKVGPYILVQILGAFCGAALVYWLTPGWNIRQASSRRSRRFHKKYSRDCWIRPSERRCCYS
jgi:glycerol uptake facilitator protein